MTFQPFILAVFICAALGVTSVTAGRINLLPGLLFHNGGETLTGQLIFFEVSNFWSLSQAFPRRTGLATVYSLDLETRRLRQVTQTSTSVFSCELFPTTDGTAFCLQYGEYGPETNALLYFEPEGVKRVISLPAVPDQRIFVGRHVFFRVRIPDETNYRTRILHYDANKDQTDIVTLPGASQWSEEFYTLPDGVQCETDNVLTFHYFRSGKKLSDGEDYKVGTYSLDIMNGRFSWLSGHRLGSDGADVMKRCDGKHVFFADTFPSEKNDGRSGRRLVVSPLREGEARLQDPKGTLLKTLTRFHKDVLFEYISPCRRYALMRRSAPARGEVGELGGIVSTYYLTDLFTGKHRVVLEDAVAEQTPNRISFMAWIDKGAKP